MNDQSISPIVERIKKLLALSTSSNEHEAALAMERVQEILIKYNLSLSDIDTETSKKVKIEIDKEIVTNSLPWRRHIAYAVAKMYMCEYFYTRRTAKGIKAPWDTHSFVGTRANVEVTKLMFTFLHETVDRLAREGALKVPQKERSPYRTTFLTHCTTRLISRIYRRIEEARAGKLKGNDGRNLPMVIDNSQELNNFIEEEVGKLKVNGNTLESKHWLGAVDGQRAGESIGLDTQIGGKAKDQTKQLEN